MQNGETQGSVTLSFGEDHSAPPALEPRIERVAVYVATLEKMDEVEVTRDLRSRQIELYMSAPQVGALRRFTDFQIKYMDDLISCKEEDVDDSPAEREYHVSDAQEIVSALIRERDDAREIAGRNVDASATAEKRVKELEAEVERLDNEVVSHERKAAVFASELRYQRRINGSLIARNEQANAENRRLRGNQRERANPGFGYYPPATIAWAGALYASGRDASESGHLRDVICGKIRG